MISQIRYQIIESGTSGLLNSVN